MTNSDTQMRAGKRGTFSLILASLGLAGLSHGSTLRGTVSGTTNAVTSALSRATVCLADDTTSCWLTRSNGTFALSFTAAPQQTTGLSHTAVATARVSEGALVLPIATSGFYRLEAVNSSGRVLESRRLALAAGVQRLALGSQTLEASGIAFVRVSGPGGTWTARLVRGKGSIHAEAGTQTLAVAAGRSAASSAVIVSAPGFVSQTVAIPTDTTKWGSLAVTLVRDPLQVRFTPDPGPFAGTLSLSMSTGITNGFIRYTTDGTAPTTLSAAFATALSISTDTFFRAQVFRSGVAQGSVQDAYWRKSMGIAPASGTYLGWVHATVANLKGDERYTLDGSVPTTASPLLDGKLGLDIDQDAFFVVRSFAPHSVPEAMEYTVQDTSLRPRITPADWFRDTFAVAMTNFWPDAEMHYTVNGATPTRSSPLYTAPLGVRSTTKVKAIAYRQGFISNVDSSTFTLISPALAPVFDTTSPATFTDSVRVSLLEFHRSGATHYTVDGSTPTTNSPIYKGPFYLKTTATVKALSGTYNPSAVASRTYTLDGMPRISPDSGFLANQTSVAVTLSSTSTEVRYTLDGTDPTEYSIGYTTPLILTSFPVTVKARAFWTGAAPSSVSSVTFTKTADGIVIPAKPVTVFSKPLAYGTLTDTRDSTIYKTVTIGSQTWMAENLNYSKGGKVGDCYDGRADSCTKYGRLYKWAEVMDGSSSSSLNPSGVQGLCPTGWHVPSDAEWTKLTDTTLASTTAGTRLKSPRGWTSGNGTDSYGFGALPGGNTSLTPTLNYRTGNTDFIPTYRSAGSDGFWWSATMFDNAYARYRSMNYGNTSVGRDYLGNAYGLSLRCLKD